MRQYTITKISGVPDWSKIPALDVDNYQWCEELDIKMKSQICYDENGLYVHLRAWEKDIRAELTEPMSMVCEDSCMEFFFRPNENDPRYINLEFNSFATMYFGLRTDRYDFINPEKDKDFFGAICHVDEKEWILQYTIPFSFIDEVFGGHTKNMYGNIYKCGGAKKHYATLYPIKTPKPDFHLSETFGAFVLE